MDVRQHVIEMKKIAPAVASLPAGVRNSALASISESLSLYREEIFEANADDLQRAEENNVPPAVKKRLRFDEHKLADCLAQIESLISLPDPAGRVTLRRQLDEGLILERVTVPIGVIGIIFEARPDAMVQISCLCIKSGNCAVLKGGKETASTNKVLFDIIQSAAAAAGIPEESLLQVSAHSQIDELLECDDCVDLLIPRGSNAFVRYIMEHTRIPVMGHSDGICHTYVDKAADRDMAVRVIKDAKTQYTAACNATETLLVHRDIAREFLPAAARELAAAGVRLRGSAEAAEILRRVSPECDASYAGRLNPPQKDASWIINPEDIMSENDFRTEYLDLILSVKIVGSVREAADHINRFGSHHTDCIITEDDDAAKEFMELVDSAGVYRNCSTRFADGFRYGFGAEVGISTGKLHARGPVGLEGLVTYKYLLSGHGQIVGDYASGKRSFHFRDLQVFD